MLENQLNILVPIMDMHAKTPHFLHELSALVRIRVSYLNFQSRSLCCL